MDTNSITIGRNTLRLLAEMLSGNQLRGLMLLLATKDAECRTTILPTAVALELWISEPEVNQAIDALVNVGALSPSGSKWVIGLL